MKEIKIGNRKVGAGHPLYFIADIGANHDGDLNRALSLIELAKEAGADAAKFQNFTAPKIVSKFGFESLGGQLSHQSSWKKSVFETYQDASISPDWTSILKQRCVEVGIDYFTSPYDFDSVDLVDPYVDVYKIGSGDITWTEILRHIAAKKKPVIIATGASEMPDVVRAMDVLQEYTQEIVLLQCNTNYTLDTEKYRYVNLNVLRTYAERFPEVVLGLSDHTLGHATVCGAVALGACVIEKHFTDSNDREGPDHKFAMNPRSWREMVENARQIHAALGDGVKRIEPNELDAAVVQRRCLRAARALEKGHILQAGDLVALRPSPEGAFAPYELPTLIGKAVLNTVAEGEHLTSKLVA